MSPQINPILIVDDDQVNLKSLRHILEGSDRLLLSANSGEEAITVLREHQDVTLILMDVSMPGIDGFETVRRIQREPALAQIPVIFITAYEKGEAEIQNGFDLGAYDVYHQGRLQDYAYPKDEVDEAMTHLPDVAR